MARRDAIYTPLLSPYMTVHADFGLTLAERALADALELLRDSRASVVAAAQRGMQCGGGCSPFTESSSGAQQEQERRVTEAEARCASAEARATEAERRAAELDAVVARLRDENASFRKVSRIVYFENENAQLRKRIEQLEAAAAGYDALSDASCGPRCEAAVGPDEVIEVYEKKIRGTLYYVSCAEGIVYRRLPDGSVGEDVGTLVKDSADGRTRLVLRVEQQGV